MSDTEKQIEFDDVLREIEVGVDMSEGNYDILRYYREEYKDLLSEYKDLLTDRNRLLTEHKDLLIEVKRLREELFNTHAFYANMEQMLAFAVGIKQGLLTNLSMDDLVDAMNRDYHDRLNEHMDGRLIE